MSFITHVFGCLDYKYCERACLFKLFIYYTTRNYCRFWGPAQTKAGCFVANWKTICLTHKFNLL